MINTFKNTKKYTAMFGGGLTVLVLLLAGALLSSNAAVKETKNKNLKEGESVRINNTETVLDKIEQNHILPPNKFEDLDIIARAAYVFKPATNHKLYTKNAHAQLPLASIAKVMNTIVVSEYMDKNTIVKVPAASLRKYGNSGLVVNEKWSVKDLVNFTMMVSSNDGANALAAVTAAFIKGTDNNNTEDFNKNIKDFKAVMNNKAHTLGLTQTFFLDEAGLDLEGGMSGAYGSARDVAYMFDYALRNVGSAMESTTIKSANFVSEDNIEHQAVNTDDLIGDIPGLIAGKTGYTPLAGGNLVVAFDAGMGDPVIAVVLGSTRKGRFEDMKKIVQAVLETPEI